MRAQLGTRNDGKFFFPNPTTDFHSCQQLDHRTHNNAPQAALANNVAPISHVTGRNLTPTTCMGPACTTSDTKLQESMRSENAGYVTLAFKLIPLDLIGDHEKTEPGKPEQLKKHIEALGAFTEAITVAEHTDGNKFIVLDGHHRSEVCRLSGLSHIPAFVVPGYLSPDSEHYILVKRWRNNSGDKSDRSAPLHNQDKHIEVTKESVMAVGNSPHKFLQKSTQHMINFTIPRINVSWESLKVLSAMSKARLPNRKCSAEYHGRRLRHSVPNLVHLQNIRRPLESNFTTFWEASDRPDRPFLEIPSEELLARCAATVSSDDESTDPVDSY